MKSGVIYMIVKNIIILGSVGNCIDILDTINEINLIEKKYNIIGFLDDNEQKWGSKVFGVEVLGGLSSAKDYKDCFFVNGIVNPSIFWKKKSIIAKTGISLDRFETIIHPTASISKFSKIGKGTVILQNVSVSSNVSIGHQVIILANSVINHDDVIGDYVSIASSVSISGNVVVSANVYIGANSSIIGNIRIGEYSLIGIGSVVLNNVSNKSIVVGNPARFLRDIEVD